MSGQSTTPVPPPPPGGFTAQPPATSPAPTPAAAPAAPVGASSSGQGSGTGTSMSNQNLNQIVRCSFTFSSLLSLAFLRLPIAVSPRCYLPLGSVPIPFHQKGVSLSKPCHFKQAISKPCTIYIHVSLKVLVNFFPKAIWFPFVAGTLSSPKPIPLRRRVFKEGDMGDSSPQDVGIIHGQLRGIVRTYF